MKKILAMLLSACMIISMSAGVMAYPDVEEGTYVSEAVTVLSNLGILDGYTDGSFKPEETITRAEMTKIICEALDYDVMGGNKTPFDDVDPKHWASGYINSAYNLRIINGYGNGKFGPEDTVTYEQAIKMVVCALGYEPMAMVNGGWSTGYTSVATTIGLTKGVNNSTRGDIAALIYNALTTPVMAQTSYGSDARYEILDGAGDKEYKTILTKRDIYIATGIVGDTFDKDYIKFEVTRDSKDGEFEASEREITFLIGNSDIADYTYQEVEVYVAEDDDEYTVLAVKAAKKTETFTLVSDDIENIVDNKVTYYVDSLNSSKTKTLIIDENATIEYNKGANYRINTNQIAVDSLDDFKDTEDIELVFIENDGDDSYDVVIATEYTSVIVELVDTYKNRISFNDGKSIVFDFDDKEKTYIFVDEKGNELTLDDFEEDDVVAYVANDDNIKDKATYIKLIKLSNSVVNGKIEAASENEKTVRIDGVEYKVLESLWGDIFKPGTEGTFYIGITGKIIYYDDATVINKYGYVIKFYNNTVEEELSVKILTPNGIKRYVIKDTYADTIDKTKEGYLAKYKINNKGLVSELKEITTKALDNDSIYNADTEMLDGQYVDNNTQIFIINTDIDESYVTDMDYLVDEGKYNGSMYAVDNEAKVIIITGAPAIYDNLTGFAIVTDSGSEVIKDDETVYAVDYVQDEVKGTIYFEDSVEELTVGTIFVFNADTDDFVKDGNYDIVATIDNYDFKPVDGYETAERYGKEVEVKRGYILNEKRNTNSKGELITIADGETYVITSETNRYTFDNAKSKNKIETEDFLGGNAYYGNKTPVMLKLVDGVVVDIYTISPKEN